MRLLAAILKLLERAPAKNVPAGGICRMPTWRIGTN